MEQTEAQYLVYNALETLGFVQRDIYDWTTGVWYVETHGRLLPFCRLMPDGEILQLEVDYEQSAPRTEVTGLRASASD